MPTSRSSWTILRPFILRTRFRRRPGCLQTRAQRLKPPFGDGGADFLHQRLEERGIVPAEQHRPEILTGLEQVVIVSAGIILARRAVHNQVVKRTVLSSLGR